MVVGNHVPNVWHACGKRKVNDFGLMCAWIKLKQLLGGGDQQLALMENRLLRRLDCQCMGCGVGSINEGKLGVGEHPNAVLIREQVVHLTGNLGVGLYRVFFDGMDQQTLVLCGHIQLILVIQQQVIDGYGLVRWQCGRQIHELKIITIIPGHLAFRSHPNKTVGVLGDGNDGFLKRAVNDFKLGMTGCGPPTNEEECPAQNPHFGVLEKRSD